MYRFPSHTEKTLYTASGREYEICICENHELEYCHKCPFDFRDMNEMSRKEAESLDAKESTLLCNRPGCLKVGKKVCSRCKLARYCSVSCQNLCWLEHKTNCNKDRNSQDGVSASFGKVNIGSKKDEIVDIIQIGTNVALYHGNGETRGKIKAFNLGKGPFKDPLSLVNYEEIKNLDNIWMSKIIDDACSCLAHYTIKCDDSSVILVEASEVHHEWEILDPNGKPILKGNDQEIISAMKNTAINISSHISSFLLVSGFMFSFQDCFYSNGLQEMLNRDSRIGRVKAMDIDSTKELLESLFQNLYSSLVLFGVGSSGPQGLKLLYREDLRVGIQKWVAAGGVLIIHGEGCIFKVFKDWFDLPWKQGGYSREETRLNRKCTSLPSRVVESLLPKSNNTKAVFATGVKQEHSLYRVPHSVNTCGVAVAPFGKGRVCFIGDVNAEANTLEVILQLGVLGAEFMREAVSAETAVQEQGKTPQETLVPDGSSSATSSSLTSHLQQQQPIAPSVTASSGDIGALGAPAPGKKSRRHRWRKRSRKAGEATNLTITNIPS